VTAIDRRHPATREWVCEAVRIIEADANRSADTHLLPFTLPAEWGVALYLKDESTHPTGSLKHRLARSLFLYALCNGWIVEGTPVIEASSGSTAVSERTSRACSTCRSSPSCRRRRARRRSR
jgi:cysteine synthase